MIRLEAKFIWCEHIAGETLGNTVRKIEGIIVAVNITVILLS